MNLEPVINVEARNPGALKKLFAEVPGSVVSRFFSYV